MLYSSRGSPASLPRVRPLEMCTYQRENVAEGVGVRVRARCVGAVPESRSSKCVWAGSPRVSPQRVCAG